MDVVVGKPTAKQHTSMDEKYKQIPGKRHQKKESVKGKDHEGLYNKHKQILNIYRQGIQNQSSKIKSYLK